MELDFLVSRANEMVDNMGRGGVASSTAEPLATPQTLDNTAGRMDAAVSSNVSFAKIHC
jgi:hypothetical protein